jgi:hypothetical protein
MIFCGKSFIIHNFRKMFAEILNKVFTRITFYLVIFMNTGLEINVS